MFKIEVLGLLAIVREYVVYIFQNSKNVLLCFLETTCQKT